MTIHKADVIVVGSGVAGVLVAWKLAEAGQSVLVLEAGERVDREAAVARYQETTIKTPDAPYPAQAWAPRPTLMDPEGYFLQAGPQPFRAIYERLVGGTTWVWAGTTPRPLPEDFVLHTLYGHGRDWPFLLNKLNKWYAEAENALGVAGGGAKVMPASPLSFLDRTLAERGSKRGQEVEAVAHARNTQEFDGRPACCGAGSCTPICPSGAKYDAGVHVRKAEAAGARILSGAVAYRLEADTRGRISSVRFRRPDGSEESAVGKRVIIAANGIETPKLLLISRDERHPNGLANSSGLVGRNLMDHPMQISFGLAGPEVYPYRGPMVNAGLDRYRRGNFRKEAGAFRTSIGNDGWTVVGQPPTVYASRLIKSGLRGEALQKKLREDVVRQIRFASYVEQLPDPENRIEPAWDQVDALGIPRPRIHYRLGEYEQAGLKMAREFHDNLMRIMGATFAKHLPDPASASHIMGTVAMGKDARSAVVDANLKSFDHSNLYLVGSGVFPTAGTANPTLTIAALAFRLADRLRRLG